MRKVFVCLAGLGFLVIFAHAFGQANNYKAVLEPTHVETRLRTDVECPYFMLSDVGLPNRILSYQYVDPAGQQQTDVIDAGKGKIVISAAAAVPNVVKVTDSNHDTTWTVFLSQSAYEANEACLKGLPSVH